MTNNLKKLYIVPYRTGSESVGLLCAKLGIKVVRIDGTSKVLSSKAHKTLLFWGSPPEPVKTQLFRNCYTAINKPENIVYATNKRRFFEAVQGCGYELESTSDAAVAFGWLADEGCKVIARDTVTGMGGEGITVLRSEKDWDNKKKWVFFTKYVPKKAEYRVHVFAGKVIAVSRKVMPKGEKPADDVWEVRSHDNGFIFQREDVKDVPSCVIDAALVTTRMCGLTFGGVDVLYNEKRKKAYVCEINSAPGIEGSTVDAYAAAVTEYVNTNIFVHE